jgi:succinate-semialdehyde dehydrogenase / glutarate-semialdehyde dehydrogenase
MATQNLQAASSAPKAGYPRVALYIDGEWINNRDVAVEVRNPSTEEVLAQVPKATAADLELALAAADRGFKLWRSTPAQQRTKIILKATGILREQLDEIAQSITLDNGKLFSDAYAEADRSLNFIEWNAAQSLRDYGLVVPGEPQMQKYVLRQPIGPVAAFTPWNVPISSAARKVSAALAAGCSVILKAAEETPGAACIVVRAFEQAGLPPGVLNLVFGNPSDISKTLIASPIVRLVTFTGSVEVGKHLTQLAAAAMKPVLMELGGNAPVLVCEGVDGAEVGKLAARGKINASGQICASPSRFIVHQSVYEDFVSAFAESVKQVRVGDGFGSEVQMGPVANARRLAAMEALVADASKRGARIAAGGARIGDKGYFFQPTVLADVPFDADAMTTEPFGPLGACVSVTDLSQAISVANSVSVGLAAYAFTNSLCDAERISRELECGVLSINHFGTPDADTPFGGVKDSGIGREGGPTSLDAYMVTKTVLQKAVKI